MGYTRKKSTSNLLLSQLLTVLIVLNTSFPMVTGADSEPQRELVTPKQSLQQVIDDAQPNSTLILSAGNYQGPIQINKPIHLKGNGAVITGMGTGHVIQIEADFVTLEGLFIQESGLGSRDAGIYAEGSHFIFADLTINQVKHGIYLNQAKDVVIKTSTISSYPDHFSKRGNGIHVAGTEQVNILQNKITGVQDGIYLEYAKKVGITGNEISNSRYGTHFMFSENTQAIENYFHHNITGFMVMYSNHLELNQNLISHHLHYRGYGTMIYEADQIQFMSNQLVQNSNALALENAQELTIAENQITGNHTGLLLLQVNNELQIKRNQWIGNMIQIRLGSADASPVPDGSLQDNYWDGYQGRDLDHNGFGDSPYFAYSSTGDFIMEIPAFQLFFQSPAMQFWSAINEQMLNPTMIKGIDPSPQMAPFLHWGQNQSIGKSAHFPITLLLFSGLLLMIVLALLNWARVEKLS